MADYILTEDDLSALDSMGFDIRGVAAGEAAMPSEIEALTGAVSNAAASGDISTMMPPPTAMPAEPAPMVPVSAPATMVPVSAPAPTTMTNTGAGTVAATMSPEELASLQVDTPSSRSPAPAQPAAANNAALMQQMLALQTPKYPSDPYENLSKTQRRMLAFSALSDAGAALAGRQGNAFNNLMKNFNDQADMQRKREAATAQQQMMTSILGGAAGAGAGIDARRQQAMMLLMNPATVALGQALLAQIEAEEKRTATQTGVVTSASNTVETVVDLMEAVKNNPSATGFWGAILGNVPFTKAGEVRIDADTLRSNMALDALKALKAQNATLGAVSEKELKLLESEIAQLNLNQTQDAVLTDLEKIKARYQSAIRAAYRDTNNTEALDAALGGRPTWLDEASRPAPSGGVQKTKNGVTFEVLN